MCHRCVKGYHDMMTKNRFNRILTAYYTGSTEATSREVATLTDRELADFLATCETLVSTATLERAKRKASGTVGGRSCY